MKLKKLKKNHQHGGVKVSIKTTANRFVPTTDPDIIIPRLFSNCDTVRLLSTGSSGFAFDMHLKPDPDSIIKLRSQTLDDSSTPLSQAHAADRDRFVDKGMPMENFCGKISLVETNKTNKNYDLDYNGGEKRGVTREDAIEEVENQRHIHEASMCATGVHGVFIPDAISHSIMDPANFELLVSSLSGVTPESQAALKWILDNATRHGYHIQVFCMELIGGIGVGGVVAGGPVFTSFRAFCDAAMAAAAAAAPAAPPPFPRAADEVACKIATAVISTFTKSSFWSFDSHGNNIMTNGDIVFLLDLGRVYNIINSKFKIDRLLKKMLLISPPHKANLVQFFGLLPGASDNNVKAAFDAIYNRYTNIDRSTIAALFTINHTVADDIVRVRSNIFEILALFALIDGITNAFEYKTEGFQCVEYMHRIFHTRSTFFDLEHFLRQCSSTLVGFEVVCSTRAAGFIIGPVISNLDAIALLLQGALVPCAAMGSPRRQFRYPNPGDPLSVGEIEHQAARAKLMEKQQRELEQQQQREQQQQQQREREQEQLEAEAALLAHVTPATPVTKQQRPAKNQTLVKSTLTKPTLTKLTATARAIQLAVAATLAGYNKNPKSKKNLEPNAGGKKTNKNKQQRSRRRRLLRRQQGHVYRTSRRKSRRRRTQ